MSFHFLNRAGRAEKPSLVSSGGGVRHIIPVSGKDSCATAIVQTSTQPRPDYELIFADVRCELPETYQWLDKVEKSLGREITRVGRSLEEIIDEMKILPSVHARFCTGRAKIDPMNDYVGEEDTTFYIGIRSDESARTKVKALRDNITIDYPLVRAGIDLKGVYALLDEKNLRPPNFFWKSLHRSVMSVLEDEHKKGFGLGGDPWDYVADLPNYLFDRLFAWRSRPNCYFCFFQSEHEFVGLLDHHPKLFDRAQEIEETVGMSREVRDKNYGRPFTWLKLCSLNWVREHRADIYDRRVRRVVRFLRTKRVEHDPDVDMMALTSCGNFCGK